MHVAHKQEYLDLQLKEEILKTDCVNVFEN
jgi:hypothetical protein